MLDLSSLRASIDSLENASEVRGNAVLMSQMPENVRDVIEAGVIQNFVFTYEICYKFMVRWITLNVSPDLAHPRTKRDTFRTAAQYGLIRDPRSWFIYTDARNETSHTYSRRKAEKILENIPEFLIDAKYFLRELELLNA